MYNLHREIEQGRYGRYGGYLESSHFFAMLGLALLLHAGGVALYLALPHAELKQIPVRVLNVKLGGGDGSGAVGTATASGDAIIPRDAPGASAANNPPPKAPPRTKTPQAQSQQDAALQALRDSYAAKARPATEVKDPVMPNIEVPGMDVPHEFVRQDVPAVTKPATGRKGARGAKGAEGSGPVSGAPQGEGSPLGNSRAADAVAVTRYTQTVSLWLERHKTYPVAARQAGLQGSLTLRLRIDRRGTILQWRVEHSSGVDALDNAMAQLVEASNPLPPVPAEYPDASPTLEFLVPIIFSL